MKPRVYISKSWAQDEHILAIVESTESGKTRVAVGFEWREHNEFDRFDNDEGLTRSDSLIQAVMDRAWEAGFRPSGFTDVKNETTAIKNHLDDMRTVAFHKLGIAK